MKTFEDLKFKMREYSTMLETQAIMDFPNGYGVSVITGKMFYTSESHPYEIAIMFEGALIYNTYITEDVLGHQTKEDVTKVMKQVQLLKP